jgi:hypothetical protein
MIGYRIEKVEVCRGFNPRDKVDPTERDHRDSNPDRRRRPTNPNYGR